MEPTSPPADEGKTGSFNYLDQSVQHSLYRNGEVLTRRDRNGSDDGDVGVTIKEWEMVVHNARLLDPGQRRTVAANGFEIVTRPIADPGLDFFHHDQVVQTYYGDCAEIVKEATGASHVFAFDHNIRSAAGKQNKRQIVGGQ